MKNIKYILLVIFCSAHLCHSQIGRLPLSPLQKIEQNIAKTDIIIEYSRPSKRDREIFGQLVPYGEYWRTGANRNTTINFSQDVIIDNQTIKKGKYSIITKPNINSWEFLLYAETTNWDVPETIDTDKIVCQTTVSPTKLNQTIESMSIAIGDFNNYAFDLEIKWDRTQITIPIALTTKATMADLIKDELEGPTAGDFYSAAVYQLESEHDYSKGLAWINKAIANRADPVWYDFRVKALLMIKLNDLDNIEHVISEGLKLAKIRKSEYGISEFESISKSLEK